MEEARLMAGESWVGREKRRRGEGLGGWSTRPLEGEGEELEDCER